MGDITSTTEIAGPVDVVFQRTLLETAHAVCPYFVGSLAAEIAEHSGSFTAKWRRIENLTPTVTPLTELGSTGGSLNLPTRTGTQASVNDLTAAIQKYGVVIYLSEEVDLINFTGQTDDLIKKLGINAGQSLNRLQRNELEDNSSQQFAGAATTATGVALAMTAADVNNVVNLLQRADALMFTPMSTGSPDTNTTPQRAAFWGICHVDVEQDIRGFTGFIPVEQYAGQVATEIGEFGSFGGVRWVSTSEASIDLAAGATTATGGQRNATGGPIDVYSSIIMGEDHNGSVGLGTAHIEEIYHAGDPLPAVQLISKGKGSAGTGDPLDEVTSLAWKSWHAAKVLTNSTTPATGEWGFALLTAADDI